MWGMLFASACSVRPVGRLEDGPRVFRAAAVRMSAADDVCQRLRAQRSFAEEERGFARCSSIEARTTSSLHAA